MKNVNIIITCQNEISKQIWRSSCAQVTERKSNGVGLVAENSFEFHFLLRIYNIHYHFYQKYTEYATLILYE